MKRGEVYWIDLLPRSGSEPRGRRPAIVVSHNSFNDVDAWRSIIVVPISTSTQQARRGPTAVPIAAGEGGLQQDSIALCHQVTTHDRRKFTQRAGLLSEEAVQAVNAGLIAALDLPS